MDRSSLSILESEDVTMISLSQEIDVHTANLRNSVLQSIASIRTKIHLQAAEALEHQQTITRATEHRLLLQIENLQDVLEARTAELERERLRAAKLLEMQCASKRREREKAAAVLTLHAWRDYVARKKHLERSAAQLTQQRQERDARQTFYAWRIQSLTAAFEEKLAKQAAEHRRTVAKVTQELQAAENAAKLETLQLKERIAQDEEQRSMLEEKMKAAFMRGVCALNLEAMQVLKSTSDVGQVNDVVSGTSGDETPAASAEAAAQRNSADQLISRQAELQNQLAALQQHQQRTSPQRAAAGGAPPVTAASSHATAGVCRPLHQPFTVSINPSYKRPSAAPGNSGSRPSSSSGLRNGTSATVARK